MGLFSLPLEIVQYLSSYLSVRDVLACSQTCHHMRNALNHNSVWKRYLPQQDISSLESHKQYLQHAFHMKPVLSPICENRIHFMRKTHLLNNWKKGCCTVHVIQEDFGSYIGVKREPILKNKGQFFDNRYFLLLANFKDHQDIELWNIEAEPVLHSSLRVKSLKHAEIAGNNLVVFVHCVIHVYKIMIKEQTLSLRYSLVTTEHSIVINTIGFPNKCKHEPCPVWNHQLHEQFLMSIRGDKLHVCNIEECSIIGDFKLSPTISFLMESRCKDLTVAKVISVFGNDVLFQVQNHYSCFSPVYFIFNTLKREVFEIKFNKTIVHCKIYNRNIITFSLDPYISNYISNKFMSITCTLHELKTFTVLNKREFDGVEKFSCSSLILVNGKFALPCYQCIKIIDVLTLNVVHQVHSLSPNLLINCFDILDSLLIAVTTSSSMVIWDIKKGEPLPDLPYFNNHHNYVSINSICTKVVCYDWVVGVISVLTFW